MTTAAGPGLRHVVIGADWVHSMLSDSDVSARLPAQDLARARAFYAQKLGLEPVEERPGGLR